MSSRVFREGGPHRISRTGPYEYSMKIGIPPDSRGFVGRECPSETCSPGYFKVKPETGITENQIEAFCPYCSYKAEPGDFVTNAQKRYAERVVEREAVDGIDRMIEKSLGLGPSRSKTIDGGFLSVKLKYEPGRLLPLGRLLEEELRRDLTCPECGLQHAVFGLATWCPDCGRDVFLSHVKEELAVLERVLSEVDGRRQRLGPRVAARDIENALEDCVSIFEAVLRALTRRYLLKQGQDAAAVEEIMRKRVGNRYQNVDFACDTCREILGVELLDGRAPEEAGKLRHTFEKRHSITHNLGVVDRKYLEKATTGELEGREVRVQTSEVIEVAQLVYRVVESVHRRLFQ